MKLLNTHTYNYDNNHNIKTLPGLSIKSFDKLDKLYFDAVSNIENNVGGLYLYKEINSMMDILDSINSKGYINDTNLKVYPLINECISILLKNYEDYTKNQKDFGKNFGSIVNIGDNLYTVKDAMIFYRWSYNLLILKLLIYCEAYSSFCTGRIVDKDLLLDFTNISKLLASKLEPSIREKFSKRGISFINNIYTGFDTEYHSIDSTTNKLLSVQMSLTTSLLLKLPKKVEFNFEEFNVFTNDTYKKNAEDLDIKKSAIKTDYVKELINNSIDYYRLINNRFTYDQTIEKITTCLKENGIRYIDKNDCIIFVFDSSKVRGFYKTTNSYSFKELILTSTCIAKQDLETNKEKVKSLLESIYKNMKLNNEYEKHGNLLEYKKFLEKISLNVDYSLNNIEPVNGDIGKSRRTNNQSFTNDITSITSVVNSYIIGHLTTADLSILNDFDEIKQEFDIINKSYVTISKPLNIEGINVYVRDTMLLAPGSMKSLQSIGSLYENLPKIDIDESYKNNMELFLLKEPTKFKEYAVRDALITMIHARYMEYFNNSLGGVGIPLTLSGLSTKFIKKYWSENKYNGYQISNKYLLSDVSTSLTPKGLSVMKDIGLKSTMYIASYRGGRNESFMYGYELSEKLWFDYDLVSAYTTGMAALGTPDYLKGHKISNVDSLNFYDLFNSYTVLNVDFEFKSDTKYPCIPVSIDENTTVYPLSGSAIITGLDYLSASNQGCKIIVRDGYRVPFVKEDDKDKNKMIKPFASCIKEIQRLRSLYEKGTIGNLLYKEIGNSLYGLTARGLNDKRKFDIKSKGMKRMIGNDLSNPLIASWITSFIRSVLGELLYYTNKLNGRVVSATTDGFITDVEDLENKILDLQVKENKVRSLLREYRNSRKYLSNNIEGLEVKKFGKDILTWTTRGQLSESSGIMAATGFQKGLASLSELQSLFLDKLKSNDKTLLFLRSSLRSALDIYKEGGHVTRTYSDQAFRVMYDNKRLIVDSNNTLLDSVPLNKADIGELLRYIGNLPKTKQYSRNSSSVNLNKYSNSIELIVRNFVKALLNNQLGLDINSFENYKHIVSFLSKYSNDIKISENYISQLKRRGSFVKVPWSIENEKFVNYVKLKFPNFDSNKIWKEGTIPAQALIKDTTQQTS